MTEVVFTRRVDLNLVLWVDRMAKRSWTSELDHGIWILSLSAGASPPLCERLCKLQINLSGAGTVVFEQYFIGYVPETNVSEGYRSQGALLFHKKDSKA
jgi:hypothetical protein